MSEQPRCISTLSLLKSQLNYPKSEALVGACLIRLERLDKAIRRYLQAFDKVKSSYTPDEETRKDFAEAKETLDSLLVSDPGEDPFEKLRVVD